MKLRRRFSIIALVCAIEMFILATLTMIGASFVQRLQNFQFLEQECQFDVADMINYLNQTVYYGGGHASGFHNMEVKNCKHE